MSDRPASGIIEFKPKHWSTWKSLEIPDDFVGTPDKFNMENLVSVRAAVALCNTDTPEVIAIARKMAADPGMAEDLLEQWDFVTAYFAQLARIMGEAASRLKVSAEIIGVSIGDPAQQRPDDAA